MNPKLKVVLCWIFFLPISLAVITWMPWIVQKFTELSYMWYNGSTEGWACVYGAPIFGNFMGGYIGLKSAGALVPKFKKTVVWILFIAFLLIGGFALFAYFSRSEYFPAIQGASMVGGFIFAFFQIERNNDYSMMEESS